MTFAPTNQDVRWLDNFVSKAIRTANRLADESILRQLVSIPLNRGLRGQALPDPQCSPPLGKTGSLAAHKGLLSACRLLSEAHHNQRSLEHCIAAPAHLRSGGTTMSDDEQAVEAT